MPAVTSKLKPSAPMIVSIALKFARSEKRIAKFATFINAKVDVPMMDEAQEQVAFERTIGVALDATAAAVRGESVLALRSLRDTAREAVMFLRDHLDELNEALDIPFVPEAVETWMVGEIADAIDDVVLPWIDSSPRLQ